MVLNLQIVLLGIGIVVVLGVYLVSRRHRPASRLASLVRRGTDSSAAKALAAKYSRPSDVPQSVPQKASQQDTGTATERTVTTRRLADDMLIVPPHRTPQTSQVAGFSRRKIGGFHKLSQIDYWVKIIGQRDVGRETVLAIYREGASNFSKASSLYGLKMVEKGWCDVQHEAEDTRFADLVLSIQLADRNGALNEREMIRFSALVAKLSECTGREFLFMTTIENASAQAANLAEFIAHFNSVYTVNIVPSVEQQFSGVMIERCAAQIGLEKEGGYYSRLDAASKNKEPLYSLTDMHETDGFKFANAGTFATYGLTFFTKPAVHRSPGAVFAEMIETAKIFATKIKGVVNYPPHNDLPEREVQATRADIEQIAEQMAQLGIAAGSDEALRIF